MFNTIVYPIWDIFSLKCFDLRYIFHSPKNNSTIFLRVWLLLGTNDLWKPSIKVELGRIMR